MSGLTHVEHEMQAEIQNTFTAVQRTNFDFVLSVSYNMKVSGFQDGMFTFSEGDLPYNHM